MNRFAARILLAGILALSLNQAFAHFKFLEPASALVTENGGKGAPPSGEGIPSGIVTKAQGGHPFTIRLLEFIPHPGHYRIALSVNSRAEIPKDADAEVKDGKSVSAPFESNPKIPVLMYGAFVHTTTPRNTEWKIDVTLPNLTCEKCTLQMTQFMAEHALNPGGATTIITARICRSRPIRGCRLRTRRGCSWGNSYHFRGPLMVRLDVIKTATQCCALGDTASGRQLFIAFSDQTRVTRVISA